MYLMAFVGQGACDLLCWMGSHWAPVLGMRARGSSLGARTNKCGPNGTARGGVRWGEQYLGMTWLAVAMDLKHSIPSFK